MKKENYIKLFFSVIFLYNFASLSVIRNVSAGTGFNNKIKARAGDVRVGKKKIEYEARSLIHIHISPTIAR